VELLSLVDHGGPEKWVNSSQNSTVAEIIEKINMRPRKCLGFKTPHQLFIGHNQHVALAS
jgi:transposase, IS30 family